MSEKPAAVKATNLTAWRKAKLAAGLCGRCGVNPLSTQKYCATCAELYRTEAKNRRKIMRDTGRCNTCGKQPLATETLCEACAGRANSGIKARQERLRATGICAQCGKRPLVNSWNCQECLDRKNAQRNARNHGMRPESYLEWVARGCAICGSMTDLHIDHDHACCNNGFTSCGSCNRAPLCRLHNNIAALLEHPDALAVLHYLENHQSSAPLLRELTTHDRNPPASLPEPAAAGERQSSGPSALQ